MKCIFSRRSGCTLNANVALSYRSCILNVTSRKTCAVRVKLCSYDPFVATHGHIVTFIPFERRQTTMTRVYEFCSEEVRVRVNNAYFYSWGTVTFKLGSF